MNAIWQCKAGGIFAIVIALSGCAGVPEDGGFSTLTTELDGRLAEDVAWRRGGADDAAVDVRINNALSEPLSLSAAVQIALLKNPELQAHYEDLGVAQADLVQAGLLSNPVFSASLQSLTDGGGPPILEFTLVQNFVDLLFLPARKRIAEAEFDATKYKTAGEVLAFAADVRSAYLEYQGALHRLAVLDEVNESAAVAADTAQTFFDAGNITELELLQEKAAAGEVQAIYNEAALEAANAREDLRLMLGLAGSDQEWNIAARLPDLPPRELADQDWVTVALTNRAELKAMAAEARAVAEEQGIAVSEHLFDDFGLGVIAEREDRSEWLIGPEIEFALPLFDQGSAARSKAASMVRSVLRESEAVAGEIVTDVRIAEAELRTAFDNALLFRDQVMPQRQRALRLTLAEYNYMFVGVFDVLEAKREELEAGLEYLDALQDYWIARSDLEAAIGRSLPAVTEQMTGDAS